MRKRKTLNEYKAVFKTSGGTPITLMITSDEVKTLMNSYKDTNTQIDLYSIRDKSHLRLIRGEAIQMRPEEAKTNV